MNDEDLEQLVQAALGNILNCAAQLADAQHTDEAAEDILAQCDLIAAYYGIARDIAHVEQHDDGSYTTRFETVVPTLDLERKPTTGVINTRGKPKLRVVDGGLDCDDEPQEPEV